MQLIYFAVALVVAVVAGFFLSPIVGIIVFVVLAGGIFLVLGGASATRTRTRTPGPTGRPRPGSSGVETSNQRQGQD
jgi:hypothetical protein